MSTTRCQAKDPSTCPYHGNPTVMREADMNKFFGVQIPQESNEHYVDRLKQEAEIHYNTFMGLDSTARNQYIQDISMNNYSDIVENLPEEKLNRFVTAQVISDEQKDRIVNSYLEAALWTAGEDEIGEPMTDSYTIHDFAPEVKEQAYRDIEKFISKNVLQASDALSNKSYQYGGDSMTQFGHDFLLTRNGEGAGFWDREALKPIGVGEALTEGSKEFRSLTVVVGDDGKLYLE